MDRWNIIQQDSSNMRQKWITCPSDTWFISERNRSLMIVDVHTVIFCRRKFISKKKITLLLQTWVWIQMNVLALYIMQFLSPPEQRRPSIFREKTRVRAQLLAPQNMHIIALQYSVGTIKVKFRFCTLCAKQDAELTIACCPASCLTLLPASYRPYCFANILNADRNTAYDWYSEIFRF